MSLQPWLKKKQNKTLKPIPVYANDSWWAVCNLSKLWEECCCVRYNYKYKGNWETRLSLNKRSLCRRADLLRATNTLIPVKFSMTKYSKASLNNLSRFCDFRRNDLYQNQFYHTLIGINKSYVPTAAHQHCNKTLLFKKLLYLLTTVLQYE